MTRASPSPPELILFDLGGVLLRYRDEWCVGALARRWRVPFRTLWPVIRSHRTALQEGRSDLRAFWDGVARSLPRTLPSDWATLWARELRRRGSANRGALALAHRLRRAGYRVGVLSNTDRSHTRLFAQRKWFSGFEPTLYSFELGAVKPTAELFRRVERQVGRPGGALLLIDDHPENVAAARRQGWQALRYDSTGALRRALRTRGLL